MATIELSPQEEHHIAGVRIYGQEIDGEQRTFANLDGWKHREFVLDVNRFGGHVDFLEHEGISTIEENEIVLSAIATFARQISQETTLGPVITVEDPDGNLL